MKLVKQILIFSFRVWPLTLILILGVCSIIVGPQTITENHTDNRRDCGNKETKAFIIADAKRRADAYNLSDRVVESVICK